MLARRYVKGTHSRSLTVRNLQLSLYGLPFSCIYMVLKDGGARYAGGFMIGFDALAWTVVGLQVRPSRRNSGGQSMVAFRVKPSSSEIGASHITLQRMAAGLRGAHCRNDGEACRQCKHLYIPAPICASVLKLVSSAWQEGLWNDLFAANKEYGVSLMPVQQNCTRTSS